MALQFVPPPAEVLSTYQTSLLDFLGPHDPPAMLHHLPVGALDLTALANGATLQDVVPSGCRFLAAWSDGKVTSCEMTNSTLYGQAQFRNFVQDDSVRTAITRIGEAADLPAVQQADLKLHFLSIPGIHLEALHLAGDGPDSDLVMPIVSADTQLATDLVLDAATFLAQARAIAAARLALPVSSSLSS
jgi:hypothetical protein